MGTFRLWLNSASKWFRRTSSSSSTTSSSNAAAAIDTSALHIDVQSIIAAVLEKHGITLTADDPAFLLVTINELVLRNVLSELNNQVTHILAEARTEMDQMKDHAAGELGRAVRTSVIAIRREMQADIDSAKLEVTQLVAQLSRIYSRTYIWRWIAAGIAAAAILTLVAFAAAYSILK